MKDEVIPPTPPTLENALGTLAELFKDDETKLKIYAFLSVDAELHKQLRFGNHAISLHSAYKLEDAIREHKFVAESIFQAKPDWVWAAGLSVVTAEKLLGGAMKIPAKPVAVAEEKVPTIPERREKEIGELIAYARYVFGKAEASDPELETLEGVVRRFEQAIKNSAPQNA